MVLSPGNDTVPLLLEKLTLASVRKADGKKPVKRQEGPLREGDVEDGAQMRAARLDRSNRREDRSERA